MSINEEGFLGQEIETIRKNLEKKYESLFNLCFELNKFAQKTKYEFKIHDQNGQEIIIACLFIKILNGFQAVVILARYGLIAEAKIITRSILEALFILKIACDDENFIQEFINYDEINRLKLMNIAHKNPSPVFNDLSHYASRKIMDDLKEKIDREKIEDLKLVNLAQRAGLQEYYDTAYRILSDPVHTTPRSLEDYTVADKSEKIISFAWGPIEKCIDMVLLTSADILLMTLEITLKLYNINKENEVIEFKNKLNKIKPESDLTEDNGV